MAVSMDISAIVDLLEIDAADVTVPLNDLKAAIEAMQAIAGTPVQVCDGRLTLTSGTAVTTGDVTAATTIYFTPYSGNRIAIYDGSNWVTYSFTEKSLSLSGLAASTPYDVFGYISAGALALEAVAWTNDTTRATALVLQDGVLCKSGTLTKRYLGTFRTTSTIGQTEDSISKRFVYNHYNQKRRRLYLTETTSHSYTTQAWRAWNNSTANRVEFIQGVLEHDINVTVQGAWGTTAVAGVGAALNSTTTPNLGSDAYVYDTGNTGQYKSSSKDVMPILGYQYIQGMEIGNTSITFTQINLTATVMG
mgnify:CR=1 FL=1